MTFTLPGQLLLDFLKIFLIFYICKLYYSKEIFCVTQKENLFQTALEILIYISEGKEDSVDVSSLICAFLGSVSSRLQWGPEHHSRAPRITLNILSYKADVAS